MKLSHYAIALGMIVGFAGFNSTDAMQGQMQMGGQMGMGGMGGGKHGTCVSQFGVNTGGCTQCCQNRWGNKAKKLNRCINLCQGQHPNSR